MVANIKIVEVPNLYPMGWEKSLVRYVKHTDYKKLPIEKRLNVIEKLFIFFSSIIIPLEILFMLALSYIAINSKLQF